MKITLTLSSISYKDAKTTSRFRFENVDTVIMDHEELVIWNNGKRNYFKPIDCIDLHVEFTSNEEKQTKEQKNKAYDKIGRKTSSH
jgi:hypothetical protein